MRQLFSRLKLLKAAALIIVLALTAVGYTNCSNSMKATNSSASSSSLSTPNPMPTPSPSTTPTQMANQFTCDPTVAPSEDTLLRLTETQFINTVKDLANSGLSTTDQAAFNTLMTTSPVTDYISGMPVEGSYAKGNGLIYDTEDQRLSIVLQQNQFSVAFAVAQFLTATPARTAAFVSHFSGSACSSTSLANTGAAKACYDAFITAFANRVLRRPLQTSNLAVDAGTTTPTAANDLTYYEAVYTNASSGGFDSLITTMLLSPDSLFFMNIHGAATSVTNQTTLTPQELAAKLSYYFTDSTPDDALMAAATANFTGTGNTVAEQVTRLMTTTKARARLANFYTQWIRPEAIPALTAATNSPSTDLVALRTNALQEMSDLTDYYTFGTNGKLADIVTSNISFAKTSDLASLYGVPVWAGRNADGSYNQSTLVSFTSSSPHSGMFTRAGYAFSGSRNSNPIVRGARLRKDYLCADLTPPADFSLNAALAVTGPPTVRNIVVANTEIPGSNCAGCHQTAINPMGFALETYDSFGRYRTTENIYATDGTVTQTVAINSNSTPNIDAYDDIPVTDGISFSAELAQSPVLHACFVKHFFRFSQARPETTSDNCVLNQMMSSLTDVSAGSLANMIKTRATAASFAVRNAGNP